MSTVTPHAETDTASVAEPRADEPQPSRVGRARARVSGLAAPRDASTIAFAALLVVAVLVYANRARDVWFYGDEWNFLAARSLRWDDLWLDHGGHLVVLPLIAYRTLFQLFGIRSYLPYAAVSIMLHATAAVLLRTVMGRVGVRPWIATSTAALFMCFGAGSSNIVRAFQITLVGSLVFGIAHLLLADHDGGWDRRDWWGVVAGLVGALCSGLAITMLLVVGLASVVRRGWRIAALHSLPLVALVLAWRTQVEASDRRTNFDLALMFRWTRDSVGATLDTVGQVDLHFGTTTVPLGGILLGVVIVAGSWLAWRQRGARAVRLNTAVALGLGGLAFAAMTASIRGEIGANVPDASRYLYIVLACLVPLLGVAVDAISRRFPLIGGATLVALAVVIPLNLATLSPDVRPGLYTNLRQRLTTIPRFDVARKVTPDLVPEPLAAPGATLGWLIKTEDSGRMGPAPAIGPEVRAAALMRVLVEQTPLNFYGGKCQPLTKPVIVTIRPEERMVVRGSLRIRLIPPTVPVESDQVLFRTSSIEYPVPYHLRATVRTVSLRLTPAGPDAMRCDQPRGERPPINGLPPTKPPPDPDAPEQGASVRDATESSDASNGDADRSNDAQTERGPSPDASRD